MYIPIDEFGMNSDYIELFDLEEYVSRIKLSKNLLRNRVKITYRF